MAERRMISKSQIMSSFFRNVSLESREIYHDLNAIADDDGIVSDAETYTELFGGSSDHLDELVKKGLLLKFEGRRENIYVIADWHNVNTVPPSKYNITQHINILCKLGIDDEGLYFDFTNGEALDNHFFEVYQKYIDAKKKEKGERCLNNLKRYAKSIPDAYKSHTVNLRNAVLGLGLDLSSVLNTNTDVNKELSTRSDKVLGSDSSLSSDINTTLERGVKGENLLPPISKEKPSVDNSTNEQRVFSNRPFNKGNNLENYTDDDIVIVLGMTRNIPKDAVNKFFVNGVTEMTGEQKQRIYNVSTKIRQQKKEA